MKIIITGASGFVGQNLSQFLKEKQMVILSLSLRDKNWKDNLHTQADAVIHLAGKAHDTKNTSSPEDYFKINRDLTIEVFKEFLNSEIRDFFFFSSVKAVADGVEGVLTEDVTANPQTPYGQSKREAEDYLLNQELPAGKRLFIIRPCMIYGPGNKGNFNLLYLVVKKGVPWPLASFENKRSFLSIDNLNYLVSEMIFKSDLESGVYNFSDDEALSVNELIQIIAKVNGNRAKLWKIPKSLIKLIAKLGDFLPLALNSERLKKLTESYVISNQKIKTALAIKELPLSAKAGLIKTIQSFKDEL